MSKSGTEIDPQELKLFTKSIAFVASAVLPSNSRRDVFHFVCSFFEGAHAPPMSELQSKAQHEAEKAICTLLRSPPSRLERQHCWSITAGRNVDWTRTLVDSAPLPPQRYCKFIQVPKHDHQFIGALLSCADFFLAMLRSTYDMSHRINKLVDAIRQPHLKGVRRAPPHHSYFYRNRHYAPELIDAVLTSLRQWDDPYTDRDIEILVTNLAKENTPNREAVKNKDTLLELMARICISKCAYDDGWQIYHKDILQKQQGLNMEICLSKDDMTCTINKNFGSHRKKVYDKDPITKLRNNMGLSKGRSTGYEPDVTIRFANGNHSCFALGDAKRNRKGDGSGYIAAAIKSTVCSSWLSFGIWCGFQHKGGSFHCELTPGFTLFVFQKPALTQQKDLLEIYDIKDMSKVYDDSASQLPLHNWFHELAASAEAFLPKIKKSENC